MFTLTLDNGKKLAILRMECYKEAITKGYIVHQLTGCYFDITDNHGRVLYVQNFAK